MSKCAGGLPPKPNPYQPRDLGSTLHCVAHGDLKGLEKIIEEIIRQQLLTRFEGARVIINNIQYNLKPGADLDETLAFIHNLRIQMDHVNSAKAKLTIVPTSTTTKDISGYVIDRHCEESIMAHNLELTVFLKQESTTFHFSKGMNHREIEAHLEAHKAELGL